MNKKITLILNLIFVGFLFSNMRCDPDSGGDPENHSLKILASDAIVAKKDEDGKNRVPEDLQKLCEVLVSEQEDCKKTIVPEPTLVRVDNDEELSLKTTLEKGFADIKNVQFIRKSISSNFKNKIEIPKSFLESKVDSIDAFSKLNTYILTKAVKDSILFYNKEAASKYYTFNNLKYKFYDDIEDVRKKMLEILCKNDKASFVLVINPPDDEAKIKDKAEARRKAEAEARRKTEAEARRKTEAEARRKAEAEARRKKGNGKDIIIKKPRKDKKWSGAGAPPQKSGTFNKKELNGDNQ